MQEYQIQASTLNLDIYRKTTPSWLIKVLKNGCTCQVTGWTFYITVKEKLSDDDEDAIIKKDITSSSDGTFLIEFTESETNPDKSQYYYDIKYRTAENKSGIALYGRITFKTPVTLR